MIYKYTFKHSGGYVSVYSASGIVPAVFHASINMNERIKPDDLLFAEAIPNAHIGPGRVVSRRRPIGPQRSAKKRKKL